MKMDILLIVIAILVVVIILYVIATYNGLVSLRNKVKDQWAQIDVQLKRRFDLIPNLVETVKGYAKHEKETLEAVINARNMFKQASSPKEEMEADNELTKCVSKLFALGESYPDLKANTSFIEMQKTLEDTENKVAYARQFYNDSVLLLNNKIEMFPSNLVAKNFKFNKEQFFETSQEEKAAPKVKF
jgi:LemA protein